MAIRFAAASALALAAALTVAGPAKAQGFFSFSFYEISPRQIVGMLDDDGYRVRGPLIRRGDVYVVNAVSISGRQTRLIVDARDGHILERYAERSDSRWRDDNPSTLRPPRDVGEDDDMAPHGQQQALGDLFNPPSRVYGNDSLFPTKPDAAPAPEAKPRHHAGKKHKEPAVAKAPASQPTPDASAAPKPDGSSVAAVAPSAPEPEVKKPAAEPPPAPKPEPAPAPKAAASPEPSPAQTKAEVEKPAPVPEPKPAPSPKSEPARKKLNDLPVGTLD